MAQKNIENQTIALAAAFQAIEQVEELAWNGVYSEQHLDTSISSILCTKPKSVVQIYDNLHMLSRGFRVLQQQLSGNVSGKKMEITRHMSALLNLANALQKNKKNMQNIAAAIQSSKIIQHNEGTENASKPLIVALSNAYIENISPLGRKVIIEGKESHLNNEHNSQVIRVFLLATIRALVLWNQLGGNRLRLILNRSKHINYAKKMSSISH